MDVRAVGVGAGRRWECKTSSQPAFLVSRATAAAVWEDLKDICPPIYDGNPLNLNRFLEKVDEWGLTVTEEMDPVAAKKYIYKPSRFRLPEALQELYFTTQKEGKIKSLRDAKRWLNEQDWVDAPQVTAK